MLEGGRRGAKLRAARVAAKPAETLETADAKTAATPDPAAAKPAATPEPVAANLALVPERAAAKPAAPSRLAERPGEEHQNAASKKRTSVFSQCIWLSACSFACFIVIVQCLVMIGICFACFIVSGWNDGRFALFCLAIQLLLHVSWVAFERSRASLRSDWQ